MAGTACADENRSWGTHNILRIALICCTYETVTVYNEIRDSSAAVDLAAWRTNMALESRHHHTHPSSGATSFPKTAASIDIYAVCANAHDFEQGTISADRWSRCNSAVQLP